MAMIHNLHILLAITNLYWICGSQKKSWIRKTVCDMSNGRRRCSLWQIAWCLFLGRQKSFQMSVTKNVNQISHIKTRKPQNCHKHCHISKWPREMSLGGVQNPYNPPGFQWTPPLNIIHCQDYIWSLLVWFTGVWWFFPGDLGSSTIKSKAALWVQRRDLPRLPANRICAANSAMLSACLTSSGRGWVINIRSLSNQKIILRVKTL